jgi:DNA polymerase-1
MPTSCSSGPSTGSPPGSPAATRNATSLACSGSSRCCAPASATTSASQRKSAKRKAIDPAYKANRPEGTPAPIKSLADVKRGLDACGIRWTEIGDEEADDVIAALAASAGSRPVTIMSGDKDYYQLLTRRVSILNTARKPGQRTIGPADIETRYGITALQWCDYRALSGDPSDGLPSIRGIGPKTAARLPSIRGIGPKTAARLLAGGLALDDLPLSGRLAGRTGKAVLDGWEQLLATRNLIRMNAGIPLPNPPTGHPSPQLPPAATIVEELGLW